MGGATVGGARMLQSPARVLSQKASRSVWGWARAERMEAGRLERDDEG